MGYGFAFISVIFSLFFCLLLLFSLIYVINLLVYRSFNFPQITGWTYLGAICGTLLATGILGTLWNLHQGPIKYGDRINFTIWYDQFINMPVYGTLFGGYPGRFIGEQIGKLSIFQRKAIAISMIVFALIAFSSYFNTGAISYGDN